MTIPTQNRKPLNVRLASPRGFCAGVDRAIRSVEEALALYGAPVFVKHEIVHNAHVISRLKAMGAVFVEDLKDAPDDRPIIFSAHGASKKEHDEAYHRQMLSIDATCPLVSKVHAGVRRYAKQNAHIYLIGHANHPEVIGTMGQTTPTGITLIETVDDVAALPERPGAKAYATQTTLSVQETRVIIEALKRKFPNIIGPNKEDICYATTNRQMAVKATAPKTDLYIVFGSPTSSNSRQLVDVAINAGAKQAILVEDVKSFNWSLLRSAKCIGVSAGASTPENLVEDFLAELASKFDVKIKTIETAQEDIKFKQPKHVNRQRPVKNQALASAAFE